MPVPAKLRVEETFTQAQNRKLNMRSLIKTTLSAIALTGFMALPMAAHAAPNQAEAAATTYTAQPFVKKKKKIKGAWRVVQENGQTLIRFSDDFKTKNGPDLKVFLSPQSIADVTGKTALDGAVLLGLLKSTKGAQDYVLPEGVSLGDFSSVLIHCEAYTVLWGGGQL